VTIRIIVGLVVSSVVVGLVPTAALSWIVINQRPLVTVPQPAPNGPGCSSRGYVRLAGTVRSPVFRFCAGGLGVHLQHVLEDIVLAEGALGLPFCEPRRDAIRMEPVPAARER
jgi:hypothetical protein